MSDATLAGLVSRAALALILTTATGDGALATPRAEELSQEERNLRAFTRLYGVLRFFHPSDEAAALPWDAFALLGVREVRGARNRKDLEATLQELVTPFAPTVEILHEGEEARPDLQPDPLPGWRLVAWQHRGPGFTGADGNTYASKRTNRQAEFAPAFDFGAFYQVVQAEALAGRPFRLTAKLRAAEGGQAGAWVRIDRQGGGRGFFDNMLDRAVTTASWQEATIEGRIDEDADRIVLGGLLSRAGTADFDAFTLQVQAPDRSWSAVPLENADFDRRLSGWTVGIAPEKPDMGALAVRFDALAEGEERLARLAPDGFGLRRDLFPARPATDEVALVDLGLGLSARVPLALWSHEDHTLPRGEPEGLMARLQALPQAQAGDRDADLADLVVAWSVLAQFYPYFDETGTDWDRALDDALVAASDDAGPLDGTQTLRGLAVALQDGHAAVHAPGERRSPLPFRLLRTEEGIVVTASNSPQILRGDLLLEVDGVEAEPALSRAAAEVSGSPQWREFLGLDRLGQGPPGSAAALRLSREGVAVEVSVPRGNQPTRDFDHPALSEVQPGCWYVDLSRVAMEEFDAQARAIARAAGVVFDMRGYPNSTHEVLRHLLVAPEHDRWMFVPERIRPALPGQPRQAPALAAHGWDLRPRAPAIQGKVVFLTGPGAISYAESVMGYVETLGIDIVGSPSAGTNGNVRPVQLPTGRELLFTGMRVTRHDGSPFHLAGVRPTVPVQPTLGGIRAGRDEVLERGLALIAQASEG